MAKCPACQAEVVSATGVCPQCGAALAVEQAAATADPFQLAGAEQASPTDTLATPTRPAAASPQFTFDVKRLAQADRITGIATLVLFVSLFLPWFGSSFGFVTVTVDGLWHGWMYIVLILSIALMVYLAGRAGLFEMRLPSGVSHGQIILAATGLNFLLTLISFVIRPSGAGWQAGAFVGLVAAAVAAGPLAIPAIQERRTRRSRKS